MFLLDYKIKAFKNFNYKSSTKGKTLFFHIINFRPESRHKKEHVEGHISIGHTKYIKM